jgi:hypothetical protein
LLRAPAELPVEGALIKLDVFTSAPDTVPEKPNGTVHQDQIAADLKRKSRAND